jgi:hypothetical protein
MVLITRDAEWSPYLGNHLLDVIQQRDGYLLPLVSPQRTKSVGCRFNLGIEDEIAQVSDD